MRRATPSPLAEGAVHTRLISPVAASIRFSAPQPSAWPLSRARTNTPFGGARSSTGAETSFAGS